MSKCSTYKRVNIGCCIVWKNEVLSVGCNQNKTRPLQKRFNVFREFENPEHIIDKQHAEIDAISKLPYFIHENNFNMSKATIYVYRENKSTHDPALALPCPACMAALKESSIGRIVYTVDDGIVEMKLSS